MRISRPSGGLLLAAAALPLFAIQTARATVIWTGNPPNTDVFKLLNLEDSSGSEQKNPSANGSSITSISDPTYGSDWQFYKAAADKRAEAHGAAGFDPAIGDTYYIGWRFKVNSTVTDNAVFQWKAYGVTGDTLNQNFPIVLKFVNGDLQLHYFAPGVIDHLLWSESEPANTWNTIVLGIHVEENDTGFINFWWDGAEQDLAGQGTTYFGSTFDSGGTSVDPKWGVYGAVGTQVTNDVNSLAIGTTYADVAPPAPEPCTSALLAVGTAAMVVVFLARRARSSLKLRTYKLPVKADNGGPALASSLVPLRPGAKVAASYRSNLSCSCSAI